MKLVLTVSNVRRFSLAIWIILILNGIPWSSALSTKASLSLSLSHHPATVVNIAMKISTILKINKIPSKSFGNLFKIAFWGHIFN